MPHFFEKVTGDTVEITGENANHIVGALRMKIGEKITLCDDGRNYECEITEIGKGFAKAKVIDCNMNFSEPDVNIALYQCVPKGDKLEFVIQKAVELGINEIVPVLSSRCVSRPDSKKAEKKNARYNEFKKAVGEIKNYDLAVLFYEGGGKPLKAIIDKEKHKNICIFIGPEGGFSDDEVTAFKQNGAETATLGKRILRTETAPLAAIVSIMLLTDNME